MFFIASCKLKQKKTTQQTDFVLLQFSINHFQIFSVLALHNLDEMFSTKFLDF